MNRIALIEDHARLATLVSRSLANSGIETDVFHQISTAWLALQDIDYGVIVIARGLPDGDGLQLVQRLRAAGRSTPCLMLSARDALSDRVGGLEAGADDYLTKPFAFSELSARLEALVRRAQIPAPAREMRLADLRLNLLTRSAERAGQPLALQPREFRLLAFLMQHAHQIVTRTMLLESVWDYRFDPQTNVIDVHISRLRGKVDKGFEPALIHTVRGVGYSLSDRPQDLPQVA